MEAEKIRQLDQEIDQLEKVIESINKNITQPFAEKVEQLKRDKAFLEKIKTIGFGKVPGGTR